MFLSSSAWLMFTLFLVQLPQKKSSLKQTNKQKIDAYPDKKKIFQNRHVCCHPCPLNDRSIFGESSLGRAEFRRERGLAGAGPDPAKRPGRATAKSEALLKSALDPRKGNFFRSRQSLQQTSWTSVQAKLATVSRHFVENHPADRHLTNAAFWVAQHWHAIWPVGLMVFNEKTRNPRAGFTCKSKLLMFEPSNSLVGKFENVPQQHHCWKIFYHSQSLLIGFFQAGSSKLLKKKRN